MREKEARRKKVMGEKSYIENNRVKTIYEESALTHVYQALFSVI